MKLLLFIWAVGVLVNIIFVAAYVVVSYCVLNGSKDAMAILESDPEYDEERMHRATEDVAVILYALLLCIIWPLLWFVIIPIVKRQGK